MTGRGKSCSPRPRGKDPLHRDKKKKKGEERGLESNWPTPGWGPRHVTFSRVDEGVSKPVGGTNCGKRRGALLIADIVTFAGRMLLFPGGVDSVPRKRKGTRREGKKHQNASEPLRKLERRGKRGRRFEERCMGRILSLPS